mgnify:CR=1 FL=1
MNRKLRLEAFIHYTLSFIGGYFGLYAILSRCGIFASAQTNNMISLVHDLLGGSPLDFLVRAGALFLYLLAIILTVWIPEHSPCNLKLLSIGIDCIACFTLGFFPAELNPVIGLYPIFFSMAFQWCTFKGAYGFAGSTTFSTNNLRQFTTAIIHLLTGKEKEASLKIRFYGGTLLNFHLGAAASFLMWQFFALRSIWCCLLPLTFALLLILSEQSAALSPKKKRLLAFPAVIITRH